MQGCRHLCALGVTYWEQLIIASLVFWFLRGTAYEGDTFLYLFLLLFFPSLSSRLVVKILKVPEYPLTALETSLDFFLGASMLLHMVHILFKVRLIT